MGFDRKWRNPSGTRAYYAWRSMRQRCLDTKHPSYACYGGRGITVCERWLNDYDAFVDDMGHPKAGESLDRINNDGGYCPDNCRWADLETQHNNRSDNVLLANNGEAKTVAQWARELGIKPGTIHRRVARMGIKRALTPGQLRAWSHGTRHGYETGCRCLDCKAAHAARHRLARARRKAKS